MRNLRILSCIAIIFVLSFKKSFIYNFSSSDSNIEIKKLFVSSTDILYYLLSEGKIDVNIVYKKGMTSVTIAWRNGCNKQGVEILIKRGADIYLKGNNGVSLADYGKRSLELKKNILISKNIV